MSISRSILIIGIDPDAVDYSQPGIPAGTTSEMIKAGLTEAQKRSQQKGDHADLCLIQLDGTAEAVIVDQLSHAKYDCIVIGGGIRLPPANLFLFETVINAVHRHAPQAAIAFNTVPEDSAEAAARWIPAR